MNLHRLIGPAARTLAVLTSAMLLAVIASSAANAQGLIWKLPPDGTWVRYEGTYRQIEFRPESAEGNLEIQLVFRFTSTARRGQTITISRILRSSGEVPPQ